MKRIYVVLLLLISLLVTSCYKDPFYKLDVRGSVGGFDDLRAPHSDTVKTYTVLVANKDATHRYQGQGSGNGYLIDGEFSPFIILTPGRTYRFSQNDSSNNGHPIIFYLESINYNNHIPSFFFL